MTLEDFSENLCTRILTHLGLKLIPRYRNGKLDYWVIDKDRSLLSIGYMHNGLYYAGVFTSLTGLVRLLIGSNSKHFIEEFRWMEREENVQEQRICSLKNPFVNCRSFAAASMMLDLLGA